MRRTREEALETRDRVLDSAELVFLEKGFAAATLEDIATAAGVTRGAIYGHFDNKAAVFQATVARVKSPMDTLIESAADAKAEDPLLTLQGALATCLRDVATDPRTQRVIKILVTHRDPGQAGWLEERNRVVGDSARARLARGLRAAVLKGQLPERLDIERGAALLHATIGGILREWLFDPSALALPKDADRIAQAVLDTLRFSPAMLKANRAAKPNAIAAT